VSEPREVEEVVEGVGYTVAPLEALGEGYGFRKIRRALGVEAFGVNAIVMPPRYEAGAHFHDQQEELYFVHAGLIELEFGDGTVQRLGPGGLARVAATTIRRLRNVAHEDSVVLVVGGSGGYVGRDAHLPEGEQRAGGPID
jgi:uncharacterized cupin superfamily protein